MLPYVIVSAIVALIVGFAVGFMTFCRSLQWCPVGGAGLRCIECTYRRTVDGRATDPTGRVTSKHRRATK